MPDKLRFGRNPNPPPAPPVPAAMAAQSATHRGGGPQPRDHEPGTAILADWNTRIAACDGFTPREARKNDEVATLRAALAAKTRECTELARRLDAAATAIAALHHDNTLMRQELDHRGQLVG